MVWIPSPSLGNVRPSVSEIKNLCLSQPVVIEVFFWQVTTNRISQHEDLKQRVSHFNLFSVSHFVMTPPSVCCSVLVSFLRKKNVITSFLLPKDRRDDINFPSKLAWSSGFDSLDSCYSGLIPSLHRFADQWQSCDHHNLLACGRTELPRRRFSISLNQSLL